MASIDSRSSRRVVLANNELKKSEIAFVRHEESIEQESDTTIDSGDENLLE